MKRCSKCGEVKALGEFWDNKTSRSRDKKCTYCKICSLMVTKEWRIKNKTRVKELKKRDYEKHREKREETRAVWIKNNRERYAEQIKLWRKNNIEYARAQVRRINRLATENLDDGYVKDLLKHQGVSSANITKELLEIKREHVKLKRIVNKLRKRRDEHESDSAYV